MRTFKVTFYAIYLLSAALVIYYGVDVLSNMDTYKENMDISFALKKLPLYTMSAFIFLGSLMLIAFAWGGFEIFNLNRKLKKADEEVLKYKARLYDQAEDEKNTLSSLPTNSEKENE